MWKVEGVEVLRELDPAGIGPFDNADTEDGILLNHNYTDMRGVELGDARLIVAHEAELLRDLEAADEDGFDALLDELCGDCSGLGSFDVGTAGAIHALSAAGAAPISSCNGGVLGEADHASGVPHILFSVAPGCLAPILPAAEEADVGLLNNAGHVEVYADELTKLNAFASRLLDRVAPVSAAAT